MADLLISQLAERSGVPATTLRFYETAGLLPAGRTPGGYRVYDEDAVDRLGFITAAKLLGLSLEDIAGLLQIWADSSCTQVRDGLRLRLAARTAEAEREAGELAAFILTLSAARDHLDTLPDRDSRCDSLCRFPAVLATQPSSPEEPWRSAPVACSLGGPAMSERVRQWQDLLSDADREPIPDGIRLSMPASLAAQVAALAAAELECCPFFDFRIHLTGQHLQLEVRAPADAMGMLFDLFAPVMIDQCCLQPKRRPERGC